LGVEHGNLPGDVLRVEGGAAQAAQLLQPALAHGVERRDGLNPKLRGERGQRGRALRVLIDQGLGERAHSLVLGLLRREFVDLDLRVARGRHVEQVAEPFRGRRLGLRGRPER
jgi:hypothetical protein